jgi:subtilisin family serine protease
VTADRRVVCACWRSQRRKVISMSLGGGVSQATNTALANAHNANIPCTVAAGNSGDDACNYSPASAPLGALLLWFEGWVRLLAVVVAGVGGRGRGCMGCGS